MNEATDLRNVAKFDGQNFQLWKFQMRAIFVANDLLSIIEGTGTRPEVTGDLQNQWIKRNAKAMFILSSSMEYSQLEYLITCTTEAEIWMKLSAIREQKNASNKLALTTKFHQYCMAASVAQHIAKVKNMANQLKDIDESVSDLMIMAKILGTLPPKYSAFVSAWNSVAAEEQTLSHLRNRLIREEVRMTSMDELSTALAASTISTEEKRDYRSSRNGDVTRKKKIVCNFRHKTGHVAKYCFARKRMQKAKNKNNNSSKKSDSRQIDSVNFTAFVAYQNEKKANNETLA